MSLEEWRKLYAEAVEGAAQQKPEGYPRPSEPAPPPRIWSDCSRLLFRFPRQSQDVEYMRIADVMMATGGEE